MMNSTVDRIRAEFRAEVAKLYHQKKKGRLSENEFRITIGDRPTLLSRIDQLDYYCDPDLDTLQWNRMQADYTAWMSGLPIDSTIGKEWLRLRNRTCVRSVTELKKVFFDIRDAVCLGIEEFEPIPSEIEKSAIGIPLYLGSCRSMEFPCKELSRLFDEPSIGIAGDSRTFSLDNGIELHVSIEAIQAEESCTTMIVSGYITEYMLPKNRHLDIIKKKEKGSAPIALFSYQSDEDLQHFYNCPRFKPYLVKSEFVCKIPSGTPVKRYMPYNYRIRSVPEPKDSG